MHYTIARTYDHDGMLQLNFNKLGNKYVVELTNKGKNETTRKRFNSIYEALDVYEKFVDYFKLGLYSYEDRKSWLEGDETT